ncbi:hypothetical protein [Wenjunlia tyrosinilytica]|uniref:Uncharacterized protein n=1 Tax=Wenjunlia tyrosinilytica TaxID=1544741 RepID=A0A917ZWR3_9ACTN|nr:hypothetical protein [Wenjunlia tyrosinilytica]GGO98195.1 hypothetical protein GCM10012280_61760 [Wenjunlia tyrosinilytica]
MTDAWAWEYDPDAENVIGGLPQPLITEIERLAASLVVLADMGEDLAALGKGPPSGGLRLLNFALNGRDGWLMFLPDTRGRMIEIVNVIWPW